MPSVLGIDTSFYTTSLCMMDLDNCVIYRKEKMLEVKKGNKGLRQQEAVFQHINNLPFLLKDYLNEYSLVAAGVSNRPRPVKGSYVPVFKAGESFLEFSCRMIGIPLFKYSHQEGHIAAGLYYSEVNKSTFLSLHVSGGTTELLKVNVLRPGVLDISRIGESKDLSAGQFVDRVGVRLGLNFPAGPELEEMALKVDRGIKVPVSIKGMSISFSGPETHTQNLIKKGYDPSEISRGVFDCIAESLEKIIKNALQQVKGIDTIMMVGGVMGNRLIKEHLEKILNNKGIKSIFIPPDLAKDNAVGISWLTKEKYQNLNNIN